MPPGVLWPLHRVATSGRYHDSLHVISTEWTIEDVFAANDLIDALAAAEGKQ